MNRIRDMEKLPDTKYGAKLYTGQENKTSVSYSYSFESGPAKNLNPDPNYFWK